LFPLLEKVTPSALEGWEKNGQKNQHHDQEGHKTGKGRSFLNMFFPHTCSSAELTASLLFLPELCWGISE
jgi:hypothetical protein